VAVARNAGSSFIAGHLALPVTRSCQRSIEFAAKQLFDKLTRSSPHLGLNRVEPIVEKINSHLGRSLQRIRLRGKVRHGVVSSPTLQCRMIRG
jgi:ribosomal protein L22